MQTHRQLREIGKTTVYMLCMLHISLQSFINRPNGRSKSSIHVITLQDSKFPSWPLILRAWCHVYWLGLFEVEPDVAAFNSQVRFYLTAIMNFFQYLVKYAKKHQRINQGERAWLITLVDQIRHTLDELQPEQCTTELTLSYHRYQWILALDE